MSIAKKFNYIEKIKVFIACYKTTVCPSGEPQHRICGSSLHFAYVNTAAFVFCHSYGTETREKDGLVISINHPTSAIF